MPSSRTPPSTRHTPDLSKLLARRVDQHRLSKREPRGGLLDVVDPLVGLQAQVLSAAELQLWARVDGLVRDEVTKALWEDRTLIKTWGMRGTLHLFSAREFPLISAALRTRAGWWRNAAWTKYHNLTPDEIEATTDAIAEALTGERLTRDELADRVSRKTGKREIAEKLRSGWGELLKPAASLGLLCFGPSQGQNVTFVRPRDWLSQWHDYDPNRALAEVLRRFLHTYGPATQADFARWWGVQPREVKEPFAAVSSELVEVDEDGSGAFMLAEDYASLTNVKPKNAVRLLPNFDPYVITMYKDRAYILEPEHKPLVYRPAGGWVSQCVIVGGRIAGVWTHSKKPDRLGVQAELFEPQSGAVIGEIEKEAARLADYHGSSLVFDIKK
jgi:hypothetical protein